MSPEPRVVECKTSFMPLWLNREIQMRGPGDYAVVTPTFTLLEVKALPEFRKLFEVLLGLGRYVGSPVRKFVFSKEGARRTFGSDTNTDIPTQVFFGYAEDPDSLESATYKGVALDEAGQKRFKRESWEAVLRRLSLHQARALITTTPYFAYGWLKTEIFDKFEAGDPDVDVINFSSIMNPAFPQAEYERARRDLPTWKFNLFYMGLISKPAGLVYDCFDESDPEIVRPRVPIPPEWKRYVGLDFGGVNTAAMFYAEEPGATRLWAYREYWAGGKTAREHAEAIKAGEPQVPYAVGGSHSEGQWRLEFRNGGLSVSEPDIKDVFLGIERVYGAHKRDEIIVFDDLHNYLDQKARYSYKLDERGEVKEPKEIEDKATYHLQDAERYILGWLKRTAPPMEAPVSTRYTSITGGAGSPFGPVGGGRRTGNPFGRG